MMKFNIAKKFSAVAIAGLIVMSASACSQTDSNPVDEQKNDSVATSTPTATEIINASSFGYDFNKASVKKSVESKYGKDSVDNLFADVFGAMAEMKINEALYKPGKKDSDVYSSLESYLTPEAWKRNAKIEDDKDSDDTTDAFNAMAFGCDEYGKTFVLKRGAKANKNPDNYEKITCDKKQELSNTKLSKIKVDTYKRKADDTLLIKSPEHVTVSGIQTQRFTGTDDKGNEQWQEMIIDFTFYVVPDKDKKNHWLVDSARWAYDYGDSSYNK